MAEPVLLPPAATRPGVFRCPADDRGLYATSGTSYFWNFLVNGQDIGRLFSLAGGTEPDRIPLVSDKEPFHPELMPLERMWGNGDDGTHAIVTLAGREVHLGVWRLAIGRASSRASTGS